jgi:hypothetical protein
MIDDVLFNDNSAWAEGKGWSLVAADRMGHLVLSPRGTSWMHPSAAQAGQIQATDCCHPMVTDLPDFTSPPPSPPIPGPAQE